MHFQHFNPVAEKKTVNDESITKTCLYNFDPLKPHFYVVKLGFTGVYVIFLISAQNIDCGYSFEPPRRGGSYEYPQSVAEQKYEKYQNFLSENFQFLVIKFSVYLNMRVFVMVATENGTVTNALCKCAITQVNFACNKAPYLIYCANAHLSR